MNFCSNIINVRRYIKNFMHCTKLMPSVVAFLLSISLIHTSVTLARTYTLFVPSPSAPPSVKRTTNWENSSQIPPHGRWRHLDAGFSRVMPLIHEWKASPNAPDDKEICRRLIDLFLVSVLLDAGAGNIWRYTEPETNQVFNRSEGLGVASFHMFRSGFFSGDANQLHRVDGNSFSCFIIRTSLNRPFLGSNTMVFFLSSCS